MDRKEYHQQILDKIRKEMKPKEIREWNEYLAIADIGDGLKLRVDAKAQTITTMARKTNKFEYAEIKRMSYSEYTQKP